MDEAHHSHDEASVKRLIDSFENAPLVGSLGTLSPIDIEATQSLVKMGKDAVPELAAALGADKPTIVIYAAYCLGQIGETSVLPRLKQVQDVYSAKEPKGAFDFSVANTARRAIESLSESSRTKRDMTKVHCDNNALTGTRLAKDGRRRDE